MTAAIAGGVGFAYGLLDAVAGTAAIMGGSGRALQSGAARNIFLRLAHAKGDEAATTAVLNEARPFFQSLANQVKQENWELPTLEVTEGMIKEESESALQELRDRTEAGAEYMLNLPGHMMEAFEGRE